MLKLKVREKIIKVSRIPIAEASKNNYFEEIDSLVGNSRMKLE